MGAHQEDLSALKKVRWFRPSPIAQLEKVFRDQELACREFQIRLVVK